MRQNAAFVGFAGRIVVAHFLTYFLFGVIFYFSGLNVLVYYEHHPNQLLAALDRHSSSVWVMAGPLFQLLRGLIFALALFPFRAVFLERRFGCFYLWGLFLALAVFGTAGGAPGSIEGIVYTNLPFACHAIFLPEVLLQTLGFSWLVIFWEHHKVNKLTVPLVAVFFLILVICALGVSGALFHLRR